MEWDDVIETTVHNEDSIKGFQGEYRWLSNFYECSVEYQGLKYKSSEAAYQAQKTEDMNEREQFTDMSPAEAKKVGKNGVKLRRDWENIKIWYMRDVLLAKFTQNEHLKEKLLATGEKYLEETNWWGDTFWGVCKGRGKNELGAMLMAVRDEIRNGYEAG